MVEYKLSYTGSEINQKLGKIDELSSSVSSLNSSLSSLNTNISSLNTKMNNLIKIKGNNWTTVSVAAETEFTAVIPISLDGYTPLGVVAYGITGTSSTFANIREIKIEGSNVYIYGRNLSPDAVSWSVYANVLYMKNQ